MKSEVAQNILGKNKRDYEALAENFSNTRAYLWPELQDLTKYVKTGDKILDLGCGNGRLYTAFRDKGIKYIGVDQSEKLIATAERRFFELGIKNYELRIADVLKSPFSENEFDVIFAVALLHHIPSRELRLKILTNCYRILKPGGFLILTVWNLWQPKLLLKYKIWPMIFGWRLKDLDWRDVLIPWSLGLKQPTQRYYHVFFKSELRCLVQQTKFKIIDNYYSSRGQKTTWRCGFNFYLVAQKPKI